MKEKFNIKDNKVFIGSIVGVLVLIILTVGATYAYFTFNADNQFGSQTINASTEGIGSGVTLVKVGEGLRLDVSATEMLEESIGNKYYASGEEESATIGKITVVGVGKYNCTYTMNITKSATSEENDLYNKFQNMSTKSEGQIYLNVNEEVYDFNTANLFPITYTETIRNITGEEYIKANLTIVNSEVDQTVLNGSDISIQFEVTEFDCTYVNDASAPETFSLVLGGTTNPEYTTTENIETYIEWEESDVESYCLTEESTSNNCEWIDVIQTRALTYNTTTTYTLSSGDGEKTVYLYLRDSAYNISQYASDTIILDTTAPTISSVTKTSDEQTSISITVSASDTNNIKTYYYSINNGSYVLSTSNTYTFNSLTAGTTYSISVYVIDNAGNQSETITQIFSTKDKLAGETILESAPSGLNTTLEGGLYRFQGTSANNYICFGTSDKSTCTGNTDAYMYRIIGINSSGELKLIKNEALNTAYIWYSDYTSNTTWPNSALYSRLNGSYFLSNTTYVPSGWSDKIATTSWKYGDSTNANVTAASLYSIENAWTNTTNAKIGLMYMHDYYYAYQSGGLNCSQSGSYSTCKTAWMFISNCDSETPSSYEWTMSRFGLYDTRYSAWSVHMYGYVSLPDLSYSRAVRPVFFLTPDVQFVSGSGTSSDPFILQ